MKAIYCLLEAFGWLHKSGLRRYIWMPLAINTVLFAGGTWYLFACFEKLMQRFLPDDSWLHYLRWLLWPFLVLAIIFGVFYTFSLVANIIAAPFNSFLAEAVERLETGSNPESGHSLWQDVWISIMQEIHKAIFFLLRAIPIIILWFIPGVNVAAPILWFFYTAWSSCLQYMDYPMSNNGLLFAEQRRILAGKPFNTLGFGGLTVLIFSIPILNLIAMPVSVIGASLHWSRNIRPTLHRMP